MKQIKIARLTLENFKCHRFLNLCFDGKNSSIYGDNATGKTSVYDALTWLLFGKDSSGNGEKNIEVKPLDSAGNVASRDAITSVEAVLFVDCEQIVLKRTYKEVWTTRRGSSEVVFTGNTSEYYIDGVPYKKNAFDEKVSEIVPDDVFRLLTSVTYFSADLSWQNRREILFSMAGTMTDQEIMASKEVFFPLLEAMGKLSLADYKKKLLADKRNFSGAKTEIPARISECQKTIDDLDGLDFAVAQAELKVLNARLDSLTCQLLAIENDTAVTQKRIAIREAQLELGTLESENDSYRREQRNTGNSVDAVEATLKALRARHSARLMTMEQESGLIARTDEKLAASRIEWTNVSSEVFTGGKCLTCGQSLPADKLQIAMDSFEQSKRTRLLQIESAASSLVETKSQAEYRLACVREEIDQLKAEIQGKEAQLEAIRSEAKPVVDMEDYHERKAAINARIALLSNELTALSESVISSKAKIQQQIAETKTMISEAMAVISKESVLQYAQNRIEALRQDAVNAAALLEAVEKMLFLIDEYVRYKTRFIEDSINSLFQIARFRLYREQANGGVEDRCDVVYDGVPYMGLNNGMKVNVGIDIINALSRHYGVCVPLFMDNAESVTHLEKTDAQLIRLVVSADDKKLRCEHEN